MAKAASWVETVGTGGDGGNGEMADLVGVGVHLAGLN